MLESILIAIFFLLGVLLGVRFLAVPADRSFLYRLILFSWAVLFALTAWINTWFPFTGSGDDESYYLLASLNVYSVGDLFDLTRFVGMMEQPGYPWLLSFINYFAGTNILAYKCMNLAILLWTGLVWYRIGSLLVDNHFGKKSALVVVALTPLWFYVFVLRKDLTIVFLQSIFLLGAIGVLQKGSSLRHWLIMAFSTLALIPFRTPLVLVNLAVLIGAFLFGAWMKTKAAGNKALLAIGTAFLIITSLNIGMNPEAMEKLGIYTEHRILLSQQMREQVQVIGEASEMKRHLFPLLYLFSETSGLNPETWAQRHAGWLRGILALPWILFCVPYFLIGLTRLKRLPGSSLASQPLQAVRTRNETTDNPWIPVLMFILVYMVISWQVGDTTRWRIPDMPAIATVALAGFMSTSPKLHYRIALLWIGAGSSLLAIFHFMRGL